MKSERRIFLAFFLNAAFSVLELIGGCLIGSTVILSDSLHDMTDAIGIAVAYALERISKRPPDDRYTYGYARYSALGGLFTSLLLLLSSTVVLVHSVNRLFQPTVIRFDEMIFLSLLGIGINLAAVYFTREGDSLNRKAVNLHMLEDVLGWGITLLGALAMKFTGWTLLDPILSIGVAVWIGIHAGKSCVKILALFLQRVPHGVCPQTLTEQLLQIDGVLAIRHLHLWSLDGQRGCASLHVVTDRDGESLRCQIRHLLAEAGFAHATLETVSPDVESNGFDCCCDTPVLAPPSHH